MIPNLPVGAYVLSVKVAGFEAHTQTSLAIEATQVLGEDVPLEVGATTDPAPTVPRTAQWA